MLCIIISFYEVINHFDSCYLYTILCEIIYTMLFYILWFTMWNVANLYFAALDITDKNYLSHGC
jgi:hypothetical protein